MIRNLAAWMRTEESGYTAGWIEEALIEKK